MWYAKERTDLKMIHDENDVFIDDELVAVRGILRGQNMHVYICETNFLVDFVSNKNGRRREKINNTRKTSWMRRSWP